MCESKNSDEFFGKALNYIISLPRILSSRQRNLTYDGIASNPEEHQYAYSPYCSLYISKGADKENLSNNQDRASSSGDYFFFLMT